MGGGVRMMPGFYHKRLRSNNIVFSRSRQRQSIGKYFGQQIVPSDWKQVKKGPVSKGPTLLNFTEPLSSVIGQKRCWTVLIARKELTSASREIGIHGLDSFLP